MAVREQLLECLYLVKRISFLAKKDDNAPSFRSALHASRFTKYEIRKAIVAEVTMSHTDYCGCFRGFGVFACEAAGPLVSFPERMVLRLGRDAFGVMETPRSSISARNGSATDQA